jgi:hypothetical protein
MARADSRRIAGGVNPDWGGESGMKHFVLWFLITFSLAIPMKSFAKEQFEASVFATGDS